MNVIELVSRIRTLEQAENLARGEYPELDFRQVDIYLEEVLSIVSEVKLFDAESIPNDSEIEIDGKRFVNLFPLAMAQEMVEDFSNAYSNILSDKEIADRLINYRINDA